jgi:hypothetical protein
VSLAVAAAALLVALSIGFAAGLDQADDLGDLGVAGVGAWLVAACGVAALAAGTTALVRDHDRRGAVVAATVVGALVSALVVQQLLEGLGVLDA